LYILSTGQARRGLAPQPRTHPGAVLTGGRAEREFCSLPVHAGALQEDKHKAMEVSKAV